MEDLKVTKIFFYILVLLHAVKRNTGYTEKRVILKAGSLELLYVEGSVTTRSVLAVPQYSVTMEKWPEDLLQKWTQFREKPKFVFGVIVESI